MLPVYVYVRIEMIPPRGSPVIPDNCYNYQVWITCGAAWTAAPRRRRERKTSMILKARFDSAQGSTHWLYIRASCLCNGKAGKHCAGQRNSRLEIVHYCTLPLSDIWVTRQIIITNGKWSIDYLDG